MSEDVADLINKQIKRKFIDGLFTSIPAEILKVDDYQSFQTVDVKPLINKIYEDGVVEKLPVLYKVPVIMLGGGGALISVPLAVGDKVLLMFSMRDIDSWKASTGENITPATKRQHSINDAIAIPGLYPNGDNLSPDATDLVMKFQGSEVRLDADGDVSITGGVNVNIDGATNVNLGNGAEKVVLGDSFLSFFNAHTHPTAGTGAPSVPTVAMSNSELSSKVKTE